MGKVLIHNIENYQYDGLWGNMEERDKYVEFIIDHDGNGNEISCTCNFEKLANYFNNLQCFTPVFFQ
jgi:hypothetical protein